MASPVAEIYSPSVFGETRNVILVMMSPKLFVLKSAPLFRWIKKGELMARRRRDENCIRSVSTQWGALSDRKFKLHSFTLRARLLQQQNKARPATERKEVTLIFTMWMWMWPYETWRENNGISFFNLCISPILNGQLLNSSIIIFFQLCGSKPQRGERKKLLSVHCSVLSVSLFKNDDIKSQVHCKQPSTMAHTKEFHWTHSYVMQFKF